MKRDTRSIFEDILLLLFLGSMLAYVIVLGFTIVAVSNGYPMSIFMRIVIIIPGICLILYIAIVSYLAQKGKF